MEKVAIVGKVPDLGEVLKSCPDPSVGGVVFFVGRPRDDGNLRGLYYEVYAEMALKELKKIREEALRRFPVREVFIYHAEGEVPVGEVSFLVAVCAAHRAEAFECCRWVVDEVKRRAPIWKKELKRTGDGSWISEDPR
ncbi:MAG: molybdenum cofactor biosynthesis protein MoaE [Aquificae bacterium]|nr:molybdenum cofactor biosynthesis protein MoaE [Aquificota bacterium]